VGFLATGRTQVGAVVWITVSALGAIAGSIWAEKVRRSGQLQSFNAKLQTSPDTDGERPYDTVGSKKNSGL
jgi:hypothetical protein